VLASNSLIEGSGSPHATSAARTRSTDPLAREV
jgi:hypothetical protein